MPTSNVILPDIIGLPPNDQFIQMGRIALPIVTFEPRIPQLGGLFYRLKPYFKNLGSGSVEESIPYYLDVLKKHGYGINPSKVKSGISYAYIADSFPTDTFTNEYSESILNTLSRGVSRIGSELTQGLGATNGYEAMEKGLGNLSEMDNFILSGIGKKGKNILESAKGIANYSGKKMRDWGFGAIPKFLSEASKLVGGGRLDFPTIWTGSGFQPSYSLTIRLYNPNPGDLETTKKYIIGPLASILIMAMPLKNKDSQTYHWPYFHRIYSPGIFDIKGGVITNITVIKGGDQHQIAFNQRLGIVDVRIDFTNLYNSMITTMDKEEIEERPTVKSYLEAMESSKDLFGDSQELETTNSVGNPINDSTITPGSRIDTNINNLYNDLKDNQPSI